MEQYEIQVVGHLDQRRARALGCKQLRLLPGGVMRSDLRRCRPGGALRPPRPASGRGPRACRRRTHPGPGVAERRRPDDADRGRFDRSPRGYGMNVLVAYATKHGATQGIAERIAVRLSAAGLRADVKPIKAVGDLSGYSAFVVGSAAYIGRWLPEATEFVRANRTVLTDRPTWLFSSGPLGTEPTDALAQDQRVAAEPKEMPAPRGDPAARPPRLLRCFDPGQARAPRPGDPDPTRRPRAAAGGRLPRLARHRGLGSGHRERAGASVGRPPSDQHHDTRRVGVTRTPHASVSALPGRSHRMSLAGRKGGAKTDAGPRCRSRN